jgi:hypothetical protein
MIKSGKQTVDNMNSAVEAAGSAGVPRWITNELLSDTIKTWQPYYTDQLTADDALEILITVGNLFDALESLQ